MDPVTLALALANFAPSIIKLFTGSDKDAAVAQKVVDVARAVTGQPSGSEALAAIQQNPDLALKLEQEAHRHAEEIARMRQASELAELEADKAALQTVNATMQAEIANSASEAWYQKGWRPFNGFCVGAGAFVGVVFTCVLFYRAIVGRDATALNVLPQLAFSLASILSIPGAAVGIASWHRGVTQRLQAQGK